MANNYQIQPDLNHHKINYDLSVITQFGILAHTYNWRMVVSGGYGLDGAIGQITRNHNDLDMILYGSQSRARARELFHSACRSLLRVPVLVFKEEEFYLECDVKSDVFVGNFYYVQTQNDPYNDLSTVIKNDGSIITNTPTDFPPPQKGSLNDLTFEIQDQSSHLKDILAKGGGNTTRHSYDLVNLEILLASPNA